MAGVIEAETRANLMSRSSDLFMVFGQRRRSVFLDVRSQHGELSFKNIFTFSTRVQLVSEGEK